MNSSFVLFQLILFFKNYDSFQLIEEMEQFSILFGNTNDRSCIDCVQFSPQKHTNIRTKYVHVYIILCVEACHSRILLSNVMKEEKAIRKCTNEHKYKANIRLKWVYLFQKVKLVEHYLLLKSSTFAM